MPRLPLRLPITSPLSTIHIHTRALPVPLLPLAQSHPFSCATPTPKGTQNSRPGWTGRHGDDHAVHRDKLDLQGDAAQTGMENKEKVVNDTDSKSNSDGGVQDQAISERDQRDSNRKAKEENPEAPGPVLGMNDERGGKGH